MTESEINALVIEDVVETAKVIEKPKKTTTRKTTKKTVEKVEEVKVEESVSATGVVTGCSFLRVRKEAVVADNVLKEIPEGTEVTILDTVENFYKIKTEAGDEGYCMSNFIRR